MSNSDIPFGRITDDTQVFGDPSDRRLVISFDEEYNPRQWDGDVLNRLNAEENGSDWSYYLHGRDSEGALYTVEISEADAEEILRDARDGVWDVLE